jgi:hypothetical protein
MAHPQRRRETAPLGRRTGLATRFRISPARRIALTSRRCAAEQTPCALRPDARDVRHHAVPGLPADSGSRIPEKCSSGPTRRELPRYRKWSASGIDWSRSSLSNITSVDIVTVDDKVAPDSHGSRACPPSSIRHRLAPSARSPLAAAIAAVASPAGPARGPPLSAARPCISTWRQRASAVRLATI